MKLTIYLQPCNKTGCSLECWWPRDDPIDGTWTGFCDVHRSVKSNTTCCR